MRPCLRIFAALSAAFVASAAADPTPGHEMRNVVIYTAAPDHIAGWPANYGIWSWGNEIVVIFTEGYRNPTNEIRGWLKTKPFVTLQSRSTDGGLTWETGPIPAHTPGGRGLSTDEHENPDLWTANVLQGAEAPAPAPANLEFGGPNFALLCARTNLKAGAVSWFYVSNDRSRSWQGPYSLPMFDQKGIGTRTDYIVSSPKELLLFLTSTKADGNEGRVLCARTTDGGQTFHFVSFVSDNPPGWEIMPSSVQLSPGHILTAIRTHIPAVKGGSAAHDPINLYVSNDNAATWTKMKSPVDDTGKGGNPPALIKLRDGRLCLAFGHAIKPYGVHAKISSDQGATWSDDIVLRDDGGDPELGYPRTIQRPDGTLVTAYFFSEKAGGGATISATLWKP